VALKKENKNCPNLGRKTHSRA